MQIVIGIYSSKFIIQIFSYIVMSIINLYFTVGLYLENV